MRRKIFINLIITLAVLVISVPANAFYSRGQVYKDISYHDFKIDRKTGAVTFTLKNNNSKKVTIFVKAQFSNIFDEYYNQVYVQKTVYPHGEKIINERLYDKIEESYNAHHINWYVRYYKVGDTVMINRLDEID